MNVTAELLDTFEFRKKGRGYDAEQVDELIARVRSTLGDLETKLADATARAEAAEARAADAETRSRTSSESDETIQRTLLLAQRTADAAVQEAEEAAAKRVGDAEIEAKRLIEEADEARARALANAEEEVRRSVEDSRTRLTQEISALEQIRNTLVADVERIEEHVELERARLRASSDALSDLLSRSDRLGQVELPELSDIDPAAAVAEVAPDQGLAVETAAGLEPEPTESIDQEAIVDWSGQDAAEAPVEDAVAAPHHGDTTDADATGADQGDEDDGSMATEDLVIDAPPPPPPPPTFDETDDGDDAAPDAPPPAPPPPPALDDDATDTESSPIAPSTSGGFGGLGGPEGDLDPSDPEDNAWLAELADDDTAGAGDGGRRRFGRRR